MKQIPLGHKRAIFVCMIALLYVLFIGFDVLRSNGWGDATRKAGTPGCICHNFALDTSVTVWITGPDTVKVGSTNNYTIFMKGGPAVSGGYNVACNNGELIPGDATSDYPSNASLELSQSSSKLFVNDTVSWKFQYKAPLTIGIDTIYSVGNSTNDNNNPDMGDLWNFGDNIAVNVVLGVDVADSETPLQYTLRQNYPNPFNPSTSISYQLEHESFVELTVYSTQGEILATLERGKRSPGTYAVTFDGSNLSSGMYFYRLRVENGSETRKMVLLK